MLDEMAENDPAAYKTFIEEQKKEEEAEKARREFLPAPGFAVETRRVDAEAAKSKKSLGPVYVNLCHHEAVGACQTADGSPATKDTPVGKLVIPLSVGPIRRFKENGAVVGVCDVCYHPDTIARGDADNTLRYYLVELALTHMEEDHAPQRYSRQFKQLGSERRWVGPRPKAQLREGAVADEKAARLEALKAMAAMGVTGPAASDMLGKMGSLGGLMPSKEEKAAAAAAAAKHKKEIVISAHGADDALMDDHFSLASVKSLNSKTAAASSSSTSTTQSSSSSSSSSSEALPTLAKKKPLIEVVDGGGGDDDEVAAAAATTASAAASARARPDFIVGAIADGAIVVTVELPLEATVADVVVDVSTDAPSTLTLSSTHYKLETLQLPVNVDSTAVRAKFSKRSRRLKLTMSVIG
jgi:hypothetical protein